MNNNKGNTILELKTLEKKDTNRCVNDLLDTAILVPVLFRAEFRIKT